MLSTSVVALDLRRRRRSKTATTAIAARAKNVQPTLMPTAVLLDSEWEVGDVDNAGNADFGADETVVELDEVSVVAKVEDA